MRVGILTALALVAALAASSCRDNEVTFYVEHMKVQPTPPGCVTSSGDEVAASGLVDLSTATAFAGWYYVTNHAMIREEYDNLRAETDGIFVDGAETYVTTTGGALIGESAYYEFEFFVPPESSTVLPAIAIPNTVIASLANDAGCPSNWDPSVQQELSQAINAGTLSQTLVYEFYDAVYARVRFIGHTQGGSEVETQEFSFMINLCCNCLIDWSACFDQCYAFCSEPEDSTFCAPGVANGIQVDDCSFYVGSETSSWCEANCEGST